MRRLGFALIVFLSLSQGFAADKLEKLKPVMVLTGTDSKQAKRSFARCHTQTEWEAIWRKHCGEGKEESRSCPEVDFDSYMVLAIFHGASSQDTGLGIDEVFREKDCLRVRYHPRSYQIGFIWTDRGEGGSGHGKQRNYKTQSFAFVVLPKSEKPIVVEEDVRHLIAPLRSGSNVRNWIEPRGSKNATREHPPDAS